MTLYCYQSMWAMEDLPRHGPEWSLDEKVSRIADAGYDGLAVDLGARKRPAADALAPLVGAHGLRSAVLVFAGSDADIADAIGYCRTIGADWMICCAKLFDFDVAAMSATVQRWHRMCADAGITFELETHRNTLTGDIRFTQMLLGALDPEIRLAADLSHYVCAHEIPDPPDNSYEELIASILERAGSVQGRIATRAQVQVPLDNPMGAIWIDTFRRWWAQGFEAILTHDRSAPLRFLTELGTTPYAITDHDGQQISDRWSESLTLMAWAREIAADVQAHSRPDRTSTGSTVA
ncbi:hypothetical protein GCM10027169_05590 [Gordonia jinhuaensis]|uniref:Sugar phosphate isomerase/epimerase n=1 Tax=Gordonia jinhuaensis TaxID=1517702 RepID=A0A916SU11_9ACTN|nr:hypothetical protein [Gordonia jinhuaensis]GGB17948.1 hypothetical protein GCM10011489_02550 [Gordonia jinhuaensis]